MYKQKEVGIISLLLFNMNMSFMTWIYMRRKTNSNNGAQEFMCNCYNINEKIGSEYMFKRSCLEKNLTLLWSSVFMTNAQRTQSATA